MATVPGAGALAMFPLGTVLLPGAPLSLHVFEPRYQALVRDCGTGGEFGVVLIERGSEVGGGDVRTGIGTLARIHDLVELPHGRFGLLASGLQAIRVDAWLDDDPYPRALVTPLFDEDDGAVASDAATAAKALRSVLAVAAEAGWEVGQAIAALDGAVLGDRAVGADVTADEWSAVSFRLAGIAPLGPADRQRLLGCRGPRQRLALLTELLADAEAVIRFGLQDGPTG